MNLRRAIAIIASTWIAATTSSTAADFKGMSNNATGLILKAEGLRAVLKPIGGPEAVNRIRHLSVAGSLEKNCNSMHQHIPRKSEETHIKSHELKADAYAFHLDIGKPIYLIHIAKCAGGSAFKSMNAIVGRAGGSFGSKEVCFPAAMLRNAANTQYVTLLRSPRTHVVSQFFMLKNKGGWCSLNSEESGLPAGTRCCSNFPQVGDEESLSLWLKWYNASDWEPSMYPLSSTAEKSKHLGNYMGSCYTPWNMQSRALTCEHEQAHRACSNKGSVPTLKQALGNLNEHSFVGLVELYSESMCLFEYRLTRNLPGECTCAHTDILWTGVAELSEKGKHESGGATYEHESVHGPTIDKLTQVDIQLYRAGVLRFVSEMRKVEVETGMRVICPSRFSILRQEVAYIDGLWESVLGLLPQNEARETNKTRVAFK
jgi:hypothetical protein